MLRKINKKLLGQIITLLILVLLSAGCSADTDKERSDTSESVQESVQEAVPESVQKSVPERHENDKQNETESDKQNENLEQQTTAKNLPTDPQRDVISAGDFLGLSVNQIKELVGKEYNVASSRGSTCFYFDDAPIVFAIGEFLPDGHKLSGNEIVKCMDVYSGHIFSGVYVGDTAATIAKKLNLNNVRLEYYEDSILTGGLPYIIYYEAEINGYNSYIFFEFESPNGGCEYAFIKSDELY